MIPKEKWKYRGLAGHFISADKCIFHLCTDIGKYRVSTVGAYYPRGPDHGEMEIIGWQRHYETMVYELANGEVLNWEGIDGEGLKHEVGREPYETDKLAEEMHQRMCLKWAEMGEMQ